MRIVGISTAIHTSTHPVPPPLGQGIPSSPTSVQSLKDISSNNNNPLVGYMKK